MRDVAAVASASSTRGANDPTNAASRRTPQRVGLLAPSDGATRGSGSGSGSVPPFAPVRPSNCTQQTSKPPIEPGLQVRPAEGNQSHRRVLTERRRAASRPPARRHRRFGLGSAKMAAAKEGRKEGKENTLSKNLSFFPPIISHAVLSAIPLWRRVCAAEQYPHPRRTSIAILAASDHCVSRPNQVISNHIQALDAEPCS